MTTKHKSVWFELCKATEHRALVEYFGSCRLEPGDETPSDDLALLLVGQGEAWPQRNRRADSIVGNVLA